jgi:hypothetical protein
MIGIDERPLHEGQIRYRMPSSSFEDGWKSVLNATPVLERLGFKASFMIIRATASAVTTPAGATSKSREESARESSRTMSHP